MSDVDVNDISHDDSSFDEGAVVSDLPDWFRCKRKWRHQKICSLAEANLIINDMPLDNPGNAWKFICKTHMSDLVKNFLDHPLLPGANPIKYLFGVITPILGLI